MTAGTVPLLHPFRVAELLDLTIRLYRKNFWTFVAIVAMVHVPQLVINGLLSIPMAQEAQKMMVFDPYTAFDPESFDPEAWQAQVEESAPFPPGLGRYFLWAGLQVLVSIALGLVAATLMTGALAWAVSERHLGRPVTVGRAYRAVFRRWKSLLGAMLLTWAVYLVLLIVAMVPCIGWLIVLPLGIFTFVCLRFVPQAVMLEGQRAGDSVRRSWHLTKPSFWRVLGIIALLYLFGLLITAGPSYIVNYGVVFFRTSYLVRTLVATTISALLGLLYLPIRLTGETLIFYDLRVRQEGLDLEMELDALAAGEEELSLSPGEAELTPLPSTPPVRQPFLTGRDWRNLAILLGVGLVALVLCCVAYFVLAGLLTALAMPLMEQMMKDIITVTPLP